MLCCFKYRSIPIFKRAQRLINGKKMFTSSYFRKGRYTRLANTENNSNDDNNHDDDQYSESIALVNSADFTLSSSSPTTEVYAHTMKARPPLQHHRLRAHDSRKTLSKKLLIPRHRQELKKKLGLNAKSFWNGMLVGLSAQAVPHTPGLYFAVVLR